MKDSFDAVNKIKNTPPHLFDDRYNYVSFDMGSLSTNVPVKRIIDIILKRLYIDKVISINLKKRSMKKPQLETCTKTVFTFNGVLYEQKDGVCVVSSFLNNLDPNLRFTGDLLENELPQFLDLELPPDGISIFRKKTNHGLYTHFSSYVTWTHRIARIKSLSSRTSRIYSPNNLSSDKNFIKKLASWNGFLIFVVESIIHEVFNTTDGITSYADLPEVLTIQVRTPDYSNKGLSICL